MKKFGIFLGALVMGVIGLVVLSEKAYRNMSDDELDAARKKALDEGYDIHSSLIKGFDWEINRRYNEIYEKENVTPKERVYREHAGILKIEK